MQLIVVVVFLIVFLYVLNMHGSPGRCDSCEPFYDWQTQGVDSSKVWEYPGPTSVHGNSDRACTTPHYQHDHSMFINTDNVGCGSCIYNKLDPSFDGVLPDWQWTLQNYGNTIFKSPPLDSDTYRVPDGCKQCSMCN